MKWDSGFSTYTCRPVWQAQIVGSACQYCIVATETASRSFRSMSFRTSTTWSGLYWKRASMLLAAAAIRRRSGSQTATMRTPFCLAELVDVRAAADAAADHRHADLAVGAPARAS